MLIQKVMLVSLLMIAFVILPLSAQQKETLAVLDFTTEAVSEIEMKAIVEFLSAELFKTRKYTVIDVSQRETILKEMEFSMQGCSDDSCALEIGKLLSAEMIVTGNLSKVGSRYLMSVKMLETETSKTMGTANGKFTDLDELIDGLETIAYSLADMEARGPAIVKAEPVAEPEPVVEKTPVETKADEADFTAEDTVAEEAKSRDTKVQVDKGGSKIGGIVCTAGGVAALGVGGYFLYNLFANSLPEYNDAADAYDYAYEENADYGSLHDAQTEAYDEAVLDLAIGAGAAVIGVALTTVGILLFPNGQTESGAEVSMSPVIYDNPGLIVRVRY
ncbi:MAG: CsgG/HfaB family protein [Spirochaetales bacterium]|uniref:CsgG/HfaB family protein n=1 Tax=Candidatus Thalassospirochaeta sargassi TaxID=3119039 RepID=A0AAJ1IJ08_9SPIO|nr:CsgG/HfaB family protein [Spirochaetales bacterium]